MTAVQAAARVQELRREIRRHDHLYWVQNQPEITDQEYDQNELAMALAGLPSVAEPM